MGITVKDNDWIRQSFMLPKDAIANADAVRRVVTSAQFKFTDTTLGGNFAINPAPQFTRWADIKVPSQFGGVIKDGSGKVVMAGSKGQGRYYSQAIDDHAQHIHMRFGLAKFNSLTNYFFNFYNPEASGLARTGRANSIFFDAGKATGTLFTLPLQGLIFAGSALNFFGGKPMSKYYYLKPAMTLYWDAVGSIVNALAVNMGMVPRVLSADERELYKADAGNDYSANDLDRFHSLMPWLWTESGGLNIYAVANKAQRLANNQRAEVKRIVENASDGPTLRKNLLKYQEERRVQADKGYVDFAAYRKAYAALPTTQPAANADDGEQAGWWWEISNKVAQFFAAEFQDGSQFVTFRVDHTETASESFSSSVGESEIAGKINGMSSAGRAANFSFAGGQTGIAPLDAILGAAKDVAAGALASVNLSGLAALAGSAFADIPKTWTGSTANLPRADYTIQLRTPYGNKMSRFMNLYVPLAMLLASALPLSTGKQSYTSPFLCELYSRGRCQIKLGMVDSLSITRGVGNLGWTDDGEPLGIDISFSVVDMSTVMHMPLNPVFSMENAVKGAVGAAAVGAGAAMAVTGVGVIPGAAVALGGAGLLASATGVFDDDNAYTDYLAVLGSMSLTDQIYTWRKFKINLTRSMVAWESWSSAAHFYNWAMGTSPARFISGLAYGSSR